MMYCTTIQKVIAFMYCLPMLDDVLYYDSKGYCIHVLYIFYIKYVNNRNV